MTGFDVVVLRNVDIGGVGSIPMKALKGDTFPRCGHGALLSALCTSGSKSTHSSGLICSSDTTARNVGRSSFPSRSTAPLLHEQ